MKQALIFILQISFVYVFEHSKPLHETLWQQKCTKKSVVLNDCNWCVCDESLKYNCKARVCNEVDMFGHFNDAIQDINVGMEGHGVWRTTESACEPGVIYRRDTLICICNEDGLWPNPICRDTFRMLHSVEVTGKISNAKSHRCEPSKLYLTDCNVCFCPSSGKIDFELCTTKTCSENDPVLYARNKDEFDEFEKKTDNIFKEVYAECNIDFKYKLGCKKCDCLRNNILICDDCTEVGSKPSNSIQSYCDDKIVNKLFVDDCNHCYCDIEGYIYCTTRKCISKTERTSLVNLMPRSHTLTKSPADDLDCVVGTSFVKDCNTCYCMENDKKEKTVGCTLKSCLRSNNDLLLAPNCIKGSVYEQDCQICHCDVIDGVSWQWCQIDSRCIGKNVEPRNDKLDSLHGYCEPLHVYKKGCNVCRCQSNGKVISCTSYICENANIQYDGSIQSNLNEKEDVTVDVVAVRQHDGEKCPEGHSYQLSCNHCYCLSNGNALCTTLPCEKNND